MTHRCFRVLRPQVSSDEEQAASHFARRLKDSVSGIRTDGKAAEATTEDALRARAAEYKASIQNQVCTL